MTEIGIRGVDLLQDRMQKTQESLKDVDENIKKLTGRSPGDFRGGRRGRGGPVSRGGRDGTAFGVGRTRLFNMARRSIGGPEIERGPPPRDRGRRSLGMRYNRDSDEEDFGRPVGLPSSVMQSNITVPSREQSITKQKQKEDRKGLVRNKRMFGLLLGTLQKFKDDSSLADKNKRRQEIEEKLEQRAKKEKAEIIRQKQNLFDERRKKTAELRRLEAKLSLVENHGIWEQETLKMKNFIRTEAKPHIFWMPKDHIPETLRKQHNSKKVIDGLIEDHKREMEKDIEALLLEAENEDHAHEDNEHEADVDEDNDAHRKGRDSHNTSFSDDEMQHDGEANQVTVSEVTHLEDDNDDDDDPIETNMDSEMKNDVSDNPSEKEESDDDHPDMNVEQTELPTNVEMLMDAGTGEHVTEVDLALASGD